MNRDHSAEDYQTQIARLTAELADSRAHDNRLVSNGGDCQGCSGGPGECERLRAERDAARRILVDARSPEWADQAIAYELAHERANKAEAERDEANAHIAECQQWLVRNGYEAGADGDLRVGMARIVDDRDAIRAEVERLRVIVDATKKLSRHWRNECIVLDPHADMLDAILRGEGPSKGG